MTTMTAARVVPEWTFGDRLRKARLEAGITQAEMARRMGERAGTYAAWESGRSEPRRLVERAHLVEQITGVSAAWLLGVETSSDQAQGDTVRYRTRAGWVLAA